MNKLKLYTENITGFVCYNLETYVRFIGNTFQVPSVKKDVLASFNEPNALCIINPCNIQKGRITSAKIFLVTNLLKAQNLTNISIVKLHLHQSPGL